MGTFKLVRFSSEIEIDLDLDSFSTVSGSFFFKIFSLWIFSTLEICFFLCPFTVFKRYEMALHHVPTPNIGFSKVSSKKLTNYSNLKKSIRSPGQDLVRTSRFHRMSLIYFMCFKVLPRFSSNKPIFFSIFSHKLRFDMCLIIIKPWKFRIATSQLFFPQSCVCYYEIKLK